MKIVLIGGSGRSGTSYLYEKVLQIPAAVGYDSVESKILYETGGLFDFYKTVTEFFSPNRAFLAKKQLLDKANKLDQMTKKQNISKRGTAYRRVSQMIDKISDRGVVELRQKELVDEAVRTLLVDLANDLQPEDTTVAYFIEKTPHNLLMPPFLEDCGLEVLRLHISRQKNLVANSVARQSWGPDNIPEAMIWVESYNHAWRIHKEKYGTKNLMELELEQIIREPDYHSRQILSFLGETSQLSLFE